MIKCHPAFLLFWLLDHKLKPSDSEPTLVAFFEHFIYTTSTKGSALKLNSERVGDAPNVNSQLIHRLLNHYNNHSYKSRSVIPFFTLFEVVFDSCRTKRGIN